MTEAEQSSVETIAYGVYTVLALICILAAPVLSFAGEGFAFVLFVHPFVIPISAIGAIVIGWMSHAQRRDKTLIRMSILSVLYLILRLYSAVTFFFFRSIRIDVDVLVAATMVFGGALLGLIIGHWASARGKHHPPAG